MAKRISLFDYIQNERRRENAGQTPGTHGLKLGDLELIKKYGEENPVPGGTVAQGKGWLTKFMPGGEYDDWSDRDPNQEGKQRVQHGDPSWGVFGKKAYEKAKEHGYSPAAIYQGLASSVLGHGGIQRIGGALTGTDGLMYKEVKGSSTSDRTGTAGNWLLGYQGEGGGFGQHSWNKVLQDMGNAYDAPLEVRDALKRSGFHQTGDPEPYGGTLNKIGQYPFDQWRNDPFITHYETTGSRAGYDPVTQKAVVNTPNTSTTTGTNTSTGSTTQTAGTVDTTSTAGTTTAAGAAGTAAGSSAVAAAQPVIGAPLSVGSAYSALGIQGAQPSWTGGGGVADFFGRKGQRKKAGINPALQINPLNL